MPRPIKWRRIEFIPQNTYFIPFGKPKCDIEEIQLKIEELEAMRLKDVEGLNQEQCAEKMKISRQTFQLIIDEARKKVAEALISGKAITISGGNYTRNICTFKCQACENVFEDSYEKEVHQCPKCSSKEVVCYKRETFCNKTCKKQCYKRSL